MDRQTHRQKVRQKKYDRNKKGTEESTGRWLIRSPMLSLINAFWIVAWALCQCSPGKQALLKTDTHLHFYSTQMNGCPYHTSPEWHLLPIPHPLWVHRLQTSRQGNRVFQRPWWVKAHRRSAPQYDSEDNPLTAVLLLELGGNGLCRMRYCTQPFFRN